MCKNPMKPTDTVVLNLAVPYVPQKRDWSCWYAGAKMVYKSRHPEIGDDQHGFFRRKLEESGAGVKVHQLKNSSRVIDDMRKSGRTYDEPADPKAAKGATEQDWPLLADALGMRGIDLEVVNQLKGLPAPLNETTMAAQLDGLLRKYGPIWSAGFFYQDGPTQNGHIIVLKGYLKRKVVGKDRYYVIFHDPGSLTGGGQDCLQMFSWFQKNLFHTGTGHGGSEGISPLMYLPDTA